MSGGATRCHSAALGIVTAGAAQMTAPLAGTEPEPPVVATTAPVASVTVSVREKAVAEDALETTSTVGSSVESAKGAPPAHEMFPSGKDGAYTPHVAMRGPGVETMTSFTGRYTPPPSYHHPLRHKWG